MQTKDNQCGIVGISLYFPDTVRTYKDIAQMSNIPEDVILNKFGINQVYVPSDDDQPSDMAVWAANDCLQKTGIDAKEIDLVIYFGENYSDYQVFSIAPKVIGEIGAENAWGYDMECKCGSFVVVMDQAKKYLNTEKDINTVMVVAGYRNIDKVNYQDTSTSFLYNLSCAGAAAIIQKGYDKHIVLENQNMANGKFAESVVVPGGGSKTPLNSSNIHDENLQYFRLNDPQGFRDDLGKVTLDNLVKVTELACKKSGIGVEDIDFACPLHMKVSAHRQLLKNLNIPVEKSLYLSDYGHTGQLDGIISLKVAEDKGLIKPGDNIAMIAMGFGYQWNAGIVQW